MGAVTAEEVETFARCMSVGGVALFPTDTVYGLATEPESKEGVRRLYALKGRVPDKPAAVMFFDLELALAAVPELGPRTAEALRRLLPAAITAVVPNPARRYPLACGPEPEKLGLRVPRLDGALAPLAAVRWPVLQSSANRSGEPRRAPARGRGARGGGVAWTWRSTAASCRVWRRRWWTWPNTSWPAGTRSCARERCRRRTWRLPSSRSRRGRVVATNGTNLIDQRQRECAPDWGSSTVCLAIPGQILEVVDEANRLAQVDVAGVQRNVNIGLLDSDGGVGPGDWVLIHVGFAMSKVDEEEAIATRRQLVAMGEDYEQELEELKASVIE